MSAREPADMVAMMARMIRAHERRLVDADPEDVADLLSLHEIIDLVAERAILSQRRRHDRSWADVGRALGITRQSAFERYADKGHIPGV